MIENWLNDLERSLQALPFEDRFDLVISYKEQIQIMQQDGLSNDAILKKLGPAHIVATNLLASFNDDEVRVEKQSTTQEPLSQTIKSHFNSATNRVKSESTRLNIANLVIFIAYVIFAFSFFATGVSLIIAALTLLIFSFSLLSLSFGLFLIMFCACILMFNIGLFICLLLYRLGKILYLKIN